MFTIRKARTKRIGMPKYDWGRMYQDDDRELVKHDPTPSPLAKPIKQPLRQSLRSVNRNR